MTYNRLGNIILFFPLFYTARNMKQFDESKVKSNKPNTEMEKMASKNKLKNKTRKSVREREKEKMNQEIEEKKCIQLFYGTHTHPHF